jgi:hypothetical protein
VAASKLADILGFSDLVPATAIREDELGSVQHLVENAQPAGRVKDANSEGWDGKTDVARAALFDYLACNIDRHMNNWMLQDAEGGAKKLALIDNGTSFPTHYDKADFAQTGKTFLLSTAYDHDLPIPDVSSWEGKWPEVEAALGEVGLEEEAIGLAKGRFDAIVAVSQQANKVGNVARFDQLPGLLEGHEKLGNLLGLTNLNYFDEAVDLEAGTARAKKHWTGKAFEESEHPRGGDQEHPGRFSEKQGGGADKGSPGKLQPKETGASKLPDIPQKSTEMIVNLAKKDPSAAKEAFQEYLSGDESDKEIDQSFSVFLDKHGAKKPSGESAQASAPAESNVDQLTDKIMSAVGTTTVAEKGRALDASSVIIKIVEKEKFAGSITPDGVALALQESKVANTKIDSQGYLTLNITNKDALKTILEAAKTGSYKGKPISRNYHLEEAAMDMAKR